MNNLDENESAAAQIYSAGPTVGRLIYLFSLVRPKKMNITEVRVHPVSFHGRTKAFATVTIDNALVIHDLRVVNGQNGLFVSMPSKKVGAQYFDISHPITTEAYRILSGAVLNQYRTTVVE